MNVNVLLVLQDKLQYSKATEEKFNLEQHTGKITYGDNSPTLLYNASRADIKEV